MHALIFLDPMMIAVLRNPYTFLWGQGFGAAADLPVGAHDRSDPGPCDYLALVRAGCNSKMSDS
jgi:hypothetical protein